MHHTTEQPLQGPQPGLASSRTVSPILLVVVLALCVRAGAILAYGPSAATRGNGWRHFKSLAINLLAGHGYCVTPATPSVYMEPGYPFFLAGTYWIFGQRWWAHGVVQAVVSTIAVVITYRLAHLVFTPRSAIISALIVALYPYLVCQITGITDTALFVTLMLLGTYCFYRASDSQGLGWSAAAGLALGLCLVTRKTVMLCMPAYLALLIFAGPANTRWRKVATAAALAGLVVFPWTIRNYRVTNKFPLLAVHPIDGVWLGNNPRTLEFIAKNVSLDAIGHLPEIRHTELDPWYVQMGLGPRESLQRAKLYRRQIQSFVLGHPQDVARLVAARFTGLWSWNYNPKDSQGNQIPPLKQWAYRLSYGPLLILFLIGCWLTGPRWPRAWPLLTIIALYTLGHLPAMGYSRLRLPLDALLAVFAGHAVVQLWATANTFWRGRSGGLKASESGEY